MDIKYHRILRMAYATPWAILPEKLAAILNFLELRAAGMRLSDAEVQAIAAARPAPYSVGVISVLPLFGTIAHRADMFSEASGGTSIQKFTRNFRAALADPSVKAIVLEVDSPGGSVEGVDELATEIYSSRSTKKIVAVANSCAASAAYWIASAAEEFVASPSAEVGSIGVIAAHLDESAYLEKEGLKVTMVTAGKFKGEGNPYQPLGEEARAALQARVDDCYGMFVRAVARQRGVKPSDVREGFGQGRMVGAKDAKAMGMIDRVATMDEVLARLDARGGSSPIMAESEQPNISADSNSAAPPSIDSERRKKHYELSQ